MASALLGGSVAVGAGCTGTARCPHSRQLRLRPVLSSHRCHLAAQRPPPLSRRHASPTSASTAAAASSPSGRRPVLGLGAQLVALWQHSVQRVGSAVKSASAALEQPHSEEVNGQIRAGLKQARMLAAVAPFAAVSGNANTLLLITRAVGSFIKLYLLFLFVRVLLSWFPAFNWETQPWLALRQVTDPYLNLFRGLVPPLLGTIDFTPLFGFLILQFLAGALDVGSDDDFW